MEKKQLAKARPQAEQRQKMNAKNHNYMPKHACGAKGGLNFSTHDDEDDLCDEGNEDGGSEIGELCFEQQQEVETILQCCYDTNLTVV